MAIFQAEMSVQSRVLAKTNGKDHRSRSGRAAFRLDVTVATGRSLLGTGHIVDMVAERDEQVEKQLTTAVTHLQLHRTAALERGAAANDEGQIVGAQLGVGVGGVSVGVPGGGKDGTALDTGFCPCRQ